MSQSELSRLQILQRVVERRMTQAAAAHYSAPIRDVHWARLRPEIELTSDCDDLI
jgi:hypothetical protein